uniref:Ubiquitin-protein ligase n=1 Tax=Solanum tuberosum TaxID=4113 RepID=M1BW23_SOLTU
MKVVFGVFWSFEYRNGISPITIQKLSRPFYTMSTFPLDVVEEILRRVPVYSVLRCRKVDYYGYGKRYFYSLPFDFLNSRVVTPKELTNPLMSSQFNTNILGSCNGLLLISNTVDEIALWNPSTGKYKKLPLLGIAKNDVRVNFGFGYDIINGDYKVVRIVPFPGSEKGSFQSHVMVYSLKSSCWRGVDE